MTTNTSIKIFIVEDEVFIADFIESTLIRAGYKNIYKAHSIKEANLVINNNIIDVVLMDINIESKMEGIELAKNLPKYCSLIYITGQSDAQIVSKAIATQPKAYLTKPIKKTDLLASIAIAALQENTVQYEIKDGHSTIHLNKNDILYVKCDNNYIDIVTKQRKFALRQTLKQFLNEIDAEYFVQVHRSYVVNKKQISKQTYNSVFINNEEIPVSRNFEQVL